MSFGELQISFLLFSAPKIPQMTSYPAASRAENSGGSRGRQTSHATNVKIAT
jgi:hypothetical protein